MSLSRGSHIASCSGATGSNPGQGPAILTGVFLGRLRNIKIKLKYKTIIYLLFCVGVKLVLTWNEGHCEQGTGGWKELHSEELCDLGRA
jgi:hypothetical protein